MYYANGATGTVSGNEISAYQKNGVHATGAGTAVQVLNNTITGRGQLDTIAQNGVVIVSGASALIDGNTIRDNWYTPAANEACGILVIDASGVKKKQNTLSGNEVDFYNGGRGGGKTNA